MSSRNAFSSKRATLGIQVYSHMFYCRFTSCDPALNLAYDEALLEVVESHAMTARSNVWEVLRLWEMPTPVVVLGRSSQVNTESHRDNCVADNVPILRRCSGGTTVVGGPGCLMYSLVLSLDARPALAMIDVAHQFVVDQLRSAIQTIAPAVEFEGICDLTLNGRKFSGNALRVKRRCLLYHGTILYDFDLSLIERYMGPPVRMPDYRQNRSHLDFLCNLGSNQKQLETLLRSQFAAHESWEQSPFYASAQTIAANLLANRYSQPAWNYSR